MTERIHDGRPSAALPDVPAAIRLARAAFRRDLPGLLADRKTRGKYVCYHRNGCAAVASTFAAIIRECVRRGLPEDEYLIEKVVPGERPDEEEVDRTLIEFDEEPS